MTLDDVVKLIRELGFPIAVAAFTLWRLEQRLKELTAAVTILAVHCSSLPEPCPLRRDRQPTTAPPP